MISHQIDRKSKLCNKIKSISFFSIECCKDEPLEQSQTISASSPSIKPLRVLESRSDKMGELPLKYQVH